jgi:hypothetical protein
MEGIGFDEAALLQLETDVTKTGRFGRFSAPDHLEGHIEKRTSASLFLCIVSKEITAWILSEVPD